MSSLDHRSLDHKTVKDVITKVKLPYRRWTWLSSQMMSANLLRRDSTRIALARQWFVLVNLLLFSSSYDTCYYHYCHYYYCSFFIIENIISFIISITVISKIGNALCLCPWERLLPGRLRGTSHCGGEWNRNPGEIFTFFGWDSDSHKPVRFLRDLTYRRLQRLV